MNTRCRSFVLMSSGSLSVVPRKSPADVPPLPVSFQTPAGVPLVGMTDTGNCPFVPSGNRSPAVGVVEPRSRSWSSRCRRSPRASRSSRSLRWSRSSRSSRWWPSSPCWLSRRAWRTPPWPRSPPSWRTERPSERRSGRRSRAAWPRGLRRQEQPPTARLIVPWSSPSDLLFAGGRRYSRVLASANEYCSPASVELLSGQATYVGKPRKPG